MCFVLVPSIILAILATRWRSKAYSVLLGIQILLLVFKTYHFTIAKFTQHQAEKLVTILSKKKAAGEFITDISPYLNELPLLRTRLTGYEVKESSFLFYYYLATPAIQNWYDSQMGWGHSDD